MKTTRCSVDGCDRTDKMVRGLCGLHEKRLRRLGTADLPVVPPVAERLAAGLVRMPNGCLEWIGYDMGGRYGAIWSNDRYVRTHRLAWELANGPIPDGLQVLHHCDNPPCCQTDPTEGYPEGHLFLGTHADNMADRDAKGRGRNQHMSATHCKRGHLFDEANTHIGSRGQRVCRACDNTRAPRHRSKRSLSLEQAA